MKITETRIKNLIPDGYEYSEMNFLDYGMKGQIVINYEKKQPKTLENYETELSRKYNLVVENEELLMDTLKRKFPKQYYSIILQMIADDICDKKMELNWCMAFHCSGQVDYRNLLNETKPQGVVLFDTLAHTKQARDIMGDKLKLLI